MKRSKFIACLIGISMVFSVCSCDKETEKTEADLTEDTTIENSVAETETDETDEYENEEVQEPEGVRLAFDEPILGFDGCYAEGGEMYDDFYYWTFYNSDGEMIGSQFGFGYKIPEYYLLDYDGDGTEELICPVQYGADLAVRVMIYRNNNGTIEECCLNERAIENRIGESLCVQNYSVTYDPEKQLISFSFNDELNYESFPLKMDDFLFYSINSIDYDLFEPEFEGWKTETVVLSKEPLLGQENWYCEKTYDGYGYTYWDFYTEDGTLFAKQFGDISEDKPLIYTQDLNGDGNDELISKCYYRDSGETHYFVYKNDHGVIKGGYLQPDQVNDIVGSYSEPSTWDYYEDYDKRNGKIVIFYFEYDKYFDVTIDDFTFVDGDPTIYFGS